MLGALPREELFLYLSAAAAGDDEKCDENQPNIVVLKKMAKAVVHRFSYPLHLQLLFLSAELLVPLCYHSMPDARFV